MKTLIFFFLVLFVLISSCAHNLSNAPSNAPSYVEQLSQRPYPTDEQGIAHECEWIRSEITRMQTLGDIAAGRQFMLGVVVARQNITALESRAAYLKCSAAFSTTHIIEKNKSTSIDECIKACKENTNRTSEQCFDACNHSKT
ncbi:MAG: hypothetical protein MUO85_04170 [candidate division Zixibacteria bacterium]|nr:hypothetical protein [candidate division Zixibacteria bacterium]